MIRTGSIRPSIAVLLAAAALLGSLPGHGGPAAAQAGGTSSGNSFELAETVQLDQADNAVMRQLEKAQALLADRQWDEAIEIICQLAETADDRDKLLAAGNRRYVTVGQWCQTQLASLPPEALKLYRARIDPVAQTWYEQGAARRNRASLQNVVDRALASSVGDRALMALGEMAFESGDFAAARRHWERILREYPDSKLDPAAVRARLVLASVVAGAMERAASELGEFARLHPDARGRLDGQKGKYAELLKALLAESRSWPAPAAATDWPTLAGNPQRNKIAPRLIDVGAVAWRAPLATAGTRLSPDRRTAGGSAAEPRSFYPALAGGLTLVNDGRRILALRCDSGQPAWGRQATIYQDELVESLAPSVPSGTLGVPRFTVTVFGDRLLARTGSPLTGWPHETTAAAGAGRLVCLDLAAEGRLLWKVEPEAGWAFEGAPIADRRGVYAAMRRQDIRPQAFVACFDPETGRLRWRRFVCSAETPAHGECCEISHNLLTLAGETIYYNTNLGAIAALGADDGRPQWVALYPRQRRGSLTRLAPHWRRDLNPCLWHDGALYVAPADSPRLFAFDAATGRALWQSSGELDDAAYLLGVAGQWLIAGGDRLYWISLRDEDRGRVKHIWPDGPDRPGCGRGILAGGDVLWTTADKLYVFDQASAQPRKIFDLAARGAVGGNLLVAADGRLLIAAEDELIAVGLQAATSPLKTE